MIVKVEVLPRRDRRMAKQIVITDREGNILFQGEDKKIVKKLDGSYKSFFLASVKENPNHSTNKIVELDTRLTAQQAQMSI